jgi:autotransporter translocation and assembly factor TamB
MGRRALGILGWTAGVLGVVFVLAAVLVYVVLQTQPGHDFVLRTVLNQAAGHVDGELRVGSLRSDGLLRGFTLHDVSIRDDRGRPFLTADSLQVRYAVRELLNRRIALVPADVWGASVVLERLHEDEHSNVARIFRLDEPREPAEEPMDLVVLLRDLRIHDSEFLVRIPIGEEDPPERVVVESVPGSEGLYQRLHFTGIGAHLAEADILRPDAPGEHLVFDRLSLTGQVLADPFELQEFRGVVRRIGTRLQVEAERFWLPESELSGVISIDWGDPETGLRLDVEAEATVVQLADLRWLEPRLPEGEGRLDLELRGPLADSQWRIRRADLTLGPSRLRGDVGFDLQDGTLRLAETDVEALPLYLEQLQPWLDEPFPVDGRVAGRVRATGPFSALFLDGRVTYDDPEREIPPSTARLSGTLLMGQTVGVREMTVEVDTLRYPTLRAFAPDLVVEGTGRLDAELSGNLPDGLRLAGSLTHRAPGDPVESRVTAEGSVQDPGDGLRVELSGSLEPLWLDGVAAGLGRELPVRGELSGPVQASGRLDDLAFSVDLQTPAGRLAASGRFDALDPGARYQAQGTVEEFALHELLAQAPNPTRVSGGFEVDGRGITAETLEGTARLNLHSIRIDRVDVDAVDAVLQAREGRLEVDTLSVRSELATLSGSGALALREDAPVGEVQIVFEAESLARLRPLVMGPRVIAADTLSELERLDLEMQGIDPDTLPSQAEVAMDGRASGELFLRGGLQDLQVDGYLEVLDAVYADLSLERGRAQVEGHWGGRDAWEARGDLEMDELAWGRFDFQAITGTAGYRSTGEGEADLELRRGEEELHRVGTGFAVDTAGVDVSLHTLSLGIDPVEWTLDAPAQLRVEGRNVQVDELALSRPGEGDEPPARMLARGTLALDGTSDLEVELTQVDIQRLAGILQVLDPPSGLLDLQVAVTGAHDSPEMEGAFRITQFAVGGTTLSLVEGELDYRDRLARTLLTADLNGRRLLTAEGRVPVDLSFAEVPDRLPDRNVEAQLSVDSLPAASLLAFVEGLEGVEGILDGRIDVRGTPRALRPSGQIQMRGGALELPELGLRIAGIAGDLQVREDRTVEISADARARGGARVAGTISLEDLADPGFDLTINASGFQAVDRRDLSARIGGEVTLTGSYTRPRVGGLVRVEQGSIFLEEFARTAEVVDLTDPAFFDVVDTTLVASRPVVAAVQNPFLQNLRVDVDLLIQRDFWLRSREMNVEMGGELIVTFDRPRREILLIGTLEAVRGSYIAFGRQFQVEGGTVEFVGTPGIDPSLDIQAVNRLRREGGEPLNVIATVGGTLTNLTVDLSSDAQPPIAESDLISYLIFNRPSYALASGETSVLEGAAGVGVSVGLGAVATQLGSVVARQFGVDYFTITQSREGPGLESVTGLGGTFADTQIEMGQYVGQNLFLAIILRPLTGLGARTQTQFPGARLEWRFTDLWTLEGFVEDRFAREAASGFGELGLRLDKVLGLSVYREWGY